MTGNTAIDIMKFIVRQDYSHEELGRSSDLRLILIAARRLEYLGEPMHMMAVVVEKK